MVPMKHVLGPILLAGWTVFPACAAQPRDEDDSLPVAAAGAPAAAPADAAGPEDAKTPAADAVAAPPADAAAAGPLEGVSPYLTLDRAAVETLRQRFDARKTHPCEIQVVGDSISESLLFLNPLTNDRRYPDMAYGGRTHCRIFGQGGIFTGVLQTAASGMTAGWGLNGEGGWGGVKNLRYPFTYTDLDPARAPIGQREAYPEIATILFGTNDLRRYVGDRYSWDKSAAGEREARGKYVAALEGIARWFLERGVVPVLITIPPGTYREWDLKVGGGKGLGERWNQDVRALGARLRVPVFDLHRLMVDQGDWRALFSDGIHPNERGYAVINEAFHRVYGDLRRLVLVR
jgi:lysophospholipase L1-like esterase